MNGVYFDKESSSPILQIFPLSVSGFYLLACDMSGGRSPVVELGHEPFVRSLLQRADTVGHLSLLSKTGSADKDVGRLVPANRPVGVSDRSLQDILKNMCFCDNVRLSQSQQSRFGLLVLSRGNMLDILRLF